MSGSRLGVALVLASAALVIAAPAGARTQHVTKTSVGVTMKEFRFVLTRASVPAGVVAFRVVNKGKIVHDFSIAGKKTKLLQPGKSEVLTVTLKKGRWPYKCTVDSHSKFGMKGVLRVT